MFDALKRKKLVCSLVVNRCRFFDWSTNKREGENENSCGHTCAL